jgi:tRNA threonylcarbamoyladenosine biosynthesis protein TsaB
VLQQCKAWLSKRIGEIHLTKPEEVEVEGIEYIAGSAIHAYRERLPRFDGDLDPEIVVTALGVLDYAKQLFAQGMQQDVHHLEPLYVRNKVALTTAEREGAFK